MDFDLALITPIPFYLQPTCSHHYSALSIPGIAPGGFLFQTLHLNKGSFIIINAQGFKLSLSLEQPIRTGYSSQLFVSLVSIYIVHFSCLLILVVYSEECKMKNFRTSLFTAILNLFIGSQMIENRIPCPHI